MHEDDLLIEPLMDMPYVGISALEHPRLSASPSLQDLGAEKHIVASKALGHEHVLQRLREVGVGDTVAFTLPSFAVGSQTLAVTDYVSVVPKALADIAESQGNIRQFTLPFSIKPGRVTLYTCRRTVQSRPVEWLRSTIAAGLAVYPYPNYVNGGVPEVSVYGPDDQEENSP